MIEGQLSPEALVAFLLAMVRTVAWLTTAPPFAGAALNGRVRVALAVALAWLMADRIPMEEIDYGIGSLIFVIGVLMFREGIVGVVSRWLKRSL